MALQKKYIVFGIIGCLCFGIGDWLLGYVDPAVIDEKVFYVIRAGHGAGFDTGKAAASLSLAVAGMCFLHPGFSHISDIAKEEKTRRFLGYAMELCSVGWLALHILVSINVAVFSQAKKIGGRGLAEALSGRLAGTGAAALFLVFLLIGVPLIMLAVCIVGQKTYLERKAAVFSPIVQMAVIFAVSQFLPASPFSYGLYTFCMNGGMIVWFGYLFDRDMKN